VADCRTFVIPSDGTGNTIEASESGYYPFGMLLMMQQLMAGTYTVTGTPSGRSLVVGAESRTYTIPAENRTLVIECEE